VSHTLSGDDADTTRLNSASTESATSILPHATDATTPSAQTTVLATPASSMASPTNARQRSLAIAVIMITVLAGLSVVVYSHFSKKANTSIESIAVLPFENRSGSSDSDYLSDGLADSLIYRLSQLPNLKVTPTSSVMRYRGKEADVSSVAKELQVDAVMSGRLTQRGDDLSISVQLIDSRNDKLIWAEQYQRKMSDLLATQREIAGSIVEQLQLKLAGGNTSAVTRRDTENNEAYQLYLKGQYQLNKRTEESLTKGVEHFRQATERDPGYALAYTGLANAYNLTSFFNVVPPREAMPKAKAAATKALEIDGTLAEAHISLAYASFTYDWDWPAATRHYDRALALDRDAVMSHSYYPFFLTVAGRSEEAVSVARRQVESDPVSAALSHTLAVQLGLSGHTDEAIAETFRGLFPVPESG